MLNRQVIIDKRCVWKRSNENIMFNQTRLPELSTIEQVDPNDSHRQSRECGVRYPVETVSLENLLEEHNAPMEIDYLSIDTEGSEFEILQEFNFNKYNIKIITCEHNYTQERSKLHELFSDNGYHQRYKDVSEFDDWWVRA
jgi:FkbM family methyltransferase